MMLDDPNEARPAPLTESERRTLIGFLVFFFGCLLIELLREFTPAKLGAFFFLAAYPLLTALHEFGHAAMAHAFGWSVHEIVIGYGRIVKRWTWRGARVEVRMLPLGGHMVPVPPASGPRRLANFFIYLAGPGAELLVVAVAAFVLGDETLTTRTDHVGIIAIQAVCGAAMMGAIINLIPLATGSGQVTDGLGMLLSPTMKPEDFARQMASPILVDGVNQLEAGDFAAAAETFAAGLRDFPDVLAIHIGYAEALIGLRRRGEALMGLSSAARDPARSERFRERAQAALDRLRARA